MAVSVSFAAIFAAILAACTSFKPRATQLRVVNSGPTAIKNLAVLFPQDEINFGDVPAGAATEYKEVPNGVYRYAAYRFEAGGETITQPVEDWIGEKPMAGRAFTYTLEIVRGDGQRLINNQTQAVRLVKVATD